MPTRPPPLTLPPGVSFQKERLSYGWAYVFRHTQLGYLGRIVLQGRADGQTHLSCEVAGDASDPMTAKRAALFAPLSQELTHRFTQALGGSGNAPWVDPPPRPPEPPHNVLCKQMTCETCGATIALLIFAEQATDVGGLEDGARLMYAQVAKLAVPTWVIGPSLGGGPPPERPAAILKIWPAREPVVYLRPAQFNPLITQLATTHCR